MSIADVYNRLFERIRQIRIEEFHIIEENLDGWRFNRGKSDGWRLNRGKSDGWRFNRGKSDGWRFNRGLEIGCGDGTQSLLLKEICDELISTDIDSSDILPEILTQLNFVEANAMSLPFPDRHFDLVYSSNVLEHIPNLEKALAEMSRVLTDDGLMIHSMPNAIWKFLQLALWFPFRFKVLFAKIGEISRGKTGTAQKKAGEFGSVKGDSTRKFNPWFPPIHGVARTHFEEFLLFRISRWNRVFENAGFKVEKSFPLLLYSAWNTGPGFLRNLFSTLGLRSSNCFFLTRKG